MTGTIPAELDGRLLRNGPNPIGDQDPATYHWFTGDGMVHGLRLRDGSAEWYRNRWVRSPEVAAALGEPAPPSPYGDDVVIFAANTNVVDIAGKTYAIVEAGSPPVELTDELETVGPSNFSGTLEHPFSAHPKVDPVTGETHVVAYHWAWGNKIRYMSLSPDGLVQKVVDVDTPGGPMVHDMAFTEKYALLFDLPVTFNLEDAMAGKRLPYSWNARVRRTHRPAAACGTATDGSDVNWVDIEPCYFYHPLNAYDLDDGRVVLDAVRYLADVRPRTARDRTRARRARSGGRSIRPRARCSRRPLDDRNQEFPRMNESSAGPTQPLRLRRDVRSARRGRRPGDQARSRGRGDRRARLRTGAADPRAGVRAARRRDRGGRRLGDVLRLRRDDRPLDVVILHAQDFTGDPVATIHLPARVPFGFHGNWIPTP